MPLQQIADLVHQTKGHKMDSSILNSPKEQKYNFIRESPGKGPAADANEEKGGSVAFVFAAAAYQMG